MKASGSWSHAAASAGWLGPWLGVGALGLWATAPTGAPLVLAAAGVAVAAAWNRRSSRTWAAGVVVLLLGILAGFVANRQVRTLRSDWNGYWEKREASVGEQLDRALTNRLDAGEAAADALAAEAADTAFLQNPDAIARLRRSFGVTAVALYDGEGRLVAWSGSHHGRVPEAVQRGRRRYAYSDLPLFGYLYVTAPAGAGTAMAALLLRTDLPWEVDADAADFATEFRREVGEGIRIVRGPVPEETGGWDLHLGDQILFTVVPERPSQSARIAETLDRWRGVVAVAAVVSWLLLAWGGAARLAAASTASLTLLLLAGALPLDRIAKLAPLFDRSLFSLPGPVPISLGRVGLLSLAAVTAIAVAPRPRIRLPAWVAGAVAALVLPFLLAWIHGGTAAGALAGGQLSWVVYQAVAVLLSSILVGTLLVLSRGGRRRGMLAPAGVVLGFLVGLGSAVFMWRAASAPVWWPALSGVPVGIVAASMGSWRGWQRPLAAWTLASLLAGAVAIPAAWGDRVEARMELGVERLHEVSAEEDPQVARALFHLGSEAERLDQGGRSGADLLWAAWRSSGLAELGQPLWLTLWSTAGIPLEELRVGVQPDRPALATQVVEEDGGIDHPKVIRYDRDDARYVLVAPLATSVLTVVAPPFANPVVSSPLDPLLEGGRSGTSPGSLTLIPITTGSSDLPDSLIWRRIGAGWQAELPVRYPNATYHAHYAVDLPSSLLAVARETLLLLLDMVLFMTFWLGGRALLRDIAPPEMRWSGLVISFRSRVTLALFGFFVLAIGIFGTLAYRTIDGASHRAARVLAERVVEDASRWYLQVGGEVNLLARRVGAELLEYRGGALRDASVEELVQLGVYEGWVPYATHRVLDARERMGDFTETFLGDWAYVAAYRRLPDGDVLAAQVPLQAGATAIRTSDLAELLGFALIVGAALSLALALLVGRTLTRPIQALQVASERVGAGNLGLRLPEGRADEFGAVFRAFNRMVGRVRRARRQLVRTSRRTRAIMEEAAVGMVALDSAGRVTLVNPRAEALLEAQIPAGAPLEVAGKLGVELSGWISSYLDEGVEESNGELHSGERRFRVRARRLGGRGAVVAFEDVTDELRTERVLAWGEMARQVAHEVKNPLTPIKLSVQHIRRAWEDRRPDFESILTKNVDAMLMEIDRLAAIAQSFSRFGAPSDASAEPLTSVDLRGVVREVLALYEASDGPVRFEGDIPGDVAPVRARVAELKEVLVNLLENARDAVKGGGLVRIEASPGTWGHVAVHVVDNGVGIPLELLPQVFEPQFSTRSTGTGLGLSIVRRLVESWGGTLNLESTRGAGTRVSLYLQIWDGGTAEGGGDVTRDPSS